MKPYYLAVDLEGDRRVPPGARGLKLRNAKPYNAKQKVASRPGRVD